MFSGFSDHGIMATGKACGRWGRLCETVQANCVLKLNLVSFLGLEVGDIMKLVTEPVSQIVEPVPDTGTPGPLLSLISDITNVTNIRCH